MPRRSVAVYGSCVSRDLVPFLNGAPRVDCYVARQSLISAFFPPIEGEFTPDLDSDFQRRMVVGDLASDAGRQLRAALKARYLLVDLVDERFGVVDVGGQRFLTPSHEYRNSGEEFLSNFEGGREIPFGSDEHWELWQVAVGRFAQFLRKTGWNQRVRLLAPAFASHTTQGDVIPPVLGRWASEWNAVYERYIDHLRLRGLVTIRLTPEEVLGDASHRWGMAPYHYSDDTAMELAARVKQSLAASGNRES